MPITFFPRFRYFLLNQSFVSVVYILVPGLYLLEQLAQFVFAPGHPFPFSLLVLCLVFAAVFAGVFAATWWFWRRRVRLIFTETELIWQGTWHRQDWRYPYANITYVAPYTYGACMFKTTLGQTQALPLLLWQNPNTTVLAELRQRLPPTCFAPNLEPRVRQMGLNLVLLGLGYVFSLLGLLYFFGGGRYWVRDHFTWPRFLGAAYPLARTQVETFSLDEQGAPRVVVQTNLFTPDALAVQQYHAAGVQTWELPATVARGDFKYFSFQSLTFDAQNHPLLLGTDFDNNGLLVWDGAQWQMRPSPLGGYASTLLVRGSHVWALLGLEDQVVYWNAATNVTHTLSLSVAVSAPTPITPTHLALAPHAAVLVAATTPTATLILRYPLAFSATAAPEMLAVWPAAQGRVAAIAQGYDGAVWLWEWSFEAAQETLHRYQPATATWQTYTAPNLGCCVTRANLPLLFENFCVDAQDRLWVQTSASIDVLTRASPAQFQRVARYNEENSNTTFLSPEPLEFGADGRVWAQDGALVWADTTTAQLPPALPGWLTFSPISWEALGLIGGGVVFMLLVEFGNAWLARRALVWH